MAILGRGSMRDKHKEEEYRHSHEPRYKHLSDDLHVEITAYAAPAEAHARIALALTEIRRFLVPVYKKKSLFHSIFFLLLYFLIDTSHVQQTAQYTVAEGGKAFMTVTRTRGAYMQQQQQSIDSFES